MEILLHTHIHHELLQGTGRKLRCVGNRWEFRHQKHYNLMEEFLKNDAAWTTVLEPFFPRETVRDCPRVNVSTSMQVCEGGFEGGFEGGLEGGFVGFESGFVGVVG